jgi:hypothetical protein
VDGDGRANGGDDDVSVTSTVTVTAVNDAPAGTDNTGTLTMAEDSRLVLSQANFGFSDTDGNAFAGVVVTTVPGAGTLYIDTDGAGGTLGTAVGAGQFVAAGAITSGQLVYVPNANASGDDTFTFQVRDNGGTANGGVDTDASANTIGITVTAVNDAPVNTVGAAVTINEDAGATALTGISVSDVEASAAGTGVYVTFEVDTASSPFAWTFRAASQARTSSPRLPTSSRVRDHRQDQRDPRGHQRPDLHGQRQLQRCRRTPGLHQRRRFGGR